MRKTAPLILILVLVSLGAPLVADVVQEPESIFRVDGLMVDGLGPEAADEGKFFSAGIKHRPLVDRRRSAPILRPPPVSMAVAGNLPPQGKALDRLRAAEVFAEQQDWRSALNEAQLGLEFDPSNLLLLRKAAAYAALARRFGVADEYFRRVVEAFPNNVPYIVGRAGVLIRLLRLGEADELIRRALMLDPGYLAARFNNVFLQIARGDAAVDPAPWDLLTLTEVEAVVNWLDADRQDYIITLTEAGFSNLCATTLGQGTRERLKDIVKALQDVSTAARLRRWKEAETSLQRLQKMGVRAIGLDMEAARQRFEAGDPEEAARRLKELSVRYPESEAALYDYAFVLISLERYAEAASALEQARRLDPVDPQIEFALACAYAGQGDVDKAWPLLEDLASRERAALRAWMQGDKPYLEALRADARYPGLFPGGPSR